MVWFLGWLSVLCSCLVLGKEPLSIVPYEPDLVRLIGVLCESICPGPPEYASIEMGDASEHIYVLRLNSPIHVKNVSSKDSWNKPEDNVFEIQIAASSKDAQHFVNKRVAITGSLFHAMTAHHRTEVVMLNNEIELLE